MGMLNVLDIPVKNVIIFLITISLQKAKPGQSQNQSQINFRLHYNLRI